MTRVNLLGGTYQARSIISDDQLCLNLFPEANQKENEIPITHYPTPGLTLLLASSSNAGTIDTGTVINPGGGYTDGTYTGVDLIGGHGTGATANFVVSGGIPGSFALVDGGINYSPSDSLTLPSILGGNGFTYTVSTVGPGVQPGEARCEYQASNGQYIRIVGPYVYRVSTTWVHTLLGTIQTTTGICYMSDNGLVMIIADGSTRGWYVDMGTFAFGQISPINFYGADKVDFLDTFFLFNIPATNQWYCSLSNITSAMLAAGTAFDPLAIAAKTGSPDPIANFTVVHLEAWLIGTLTAEIWYDAGTADFPFGRLPGTFIEHGIAAPKSLAKHDLKLFWLSQDREGHAEVVLGSDYRATRISTHSVEYAINKYSNFTDAIGFCYQQEGHIFYVLTFPSGDATWVFDLTSGYWHQRCWSDSNGVRHRVRPQVMANAYQTLTAGDWQTGDLYKVDLNNYTDNGAPIVRARRFKHLIEEDAKISYPYFIADMEPGDDLGSDGSTSSNPPKISLRWSDDRGRTFGNYLMQSLGAIGQYNTSIRWSRLGMGRDRIYELSWSVNAKTSLQGAWLSTTITGN